MTTLSDLITAQDALVASLADGLLSAQVLTVSADPTKYNTAQYPGARIQRVAYAPQGADNTDRTFDDAFTVSAGKYGVIVSTFSALGGGTFATIAAATTQAYNTAQAAIDARPSPPAGTVEQGYIVINNSAGIAPWVANTDSLAGVSTIVNASVVPALPAPLA